MVITSDTGLGADPAASARKTRQSPHLPGSAASASGRIVVRRNEQVQGARRVETNPRAREGPMIDGFTRVLQTASDLRVLLGLVRGAPCSSCLHPLRRAVLLLGRARIAGQNSRRPSTSRAAVGSSSTSRSGSATSAMAKTDALGLAARELRRRPIGEFCGAGETKYVVQLEWMRVERRDHCEELADTQELDERSRLEHCADGPGLRGLSGRRAEHRDRSGVRSSEPEHHVDRGRLSRTIWPEGRQVSPGAIATSIPRAARSSP